MSERCGHCEEELRYGHSYNRPMERIAELEAANARLATALERVVIASEAFYWGGRVDEVLDVDRLCDADVTEMSAATTAARTLLAQLRAEYGRP